MVWLLMELGHSWPHCVISRSIFIVIALWWTSQRKPVLVIHEDFLLKNLSLSHFYPPGWTIIIPYYFVVYHIWVRCCQNCHVYIYTLICKWHVIYYTLTQNKYYLHLWTLQTKCWMRSTNLFHIRLSGRSQKSNVIVQSCTLSSPWHIWYNPTVGVLDFLWHLELTKYLFSVEDPHIYLRQLAVKEKTKISAVQPLEKGKEILL